MSDNINRGDKTQKYLRYFSRSSLVSMLPLILRILGSSADIAELLSSSGFQLNLILVILVIGLNVYVEVELNENNPDEVNRDSQKQIQRSRSANKSEIKNLRKVLIFSILLSIIVIVTVGQFGYQYLSWQLTIDRFERSREYTETNPTILPSFEDNVLFTSNYEGISNFNLSLGKLQDELTYQIVVDQEVPTNNVFLITDNSSIISPSVVFKFDKVAEGRDFLVQSYRIKWVNTGRYFEGNSFVDDLIYRVISDNNWHEFIHIESVDGYQVWNYLDGELVSQIDKNTDRIAHTQTSSIRDGLLTGHLLGYRNEEILQIQPRLDDTVRSSHEVSGLGLFSPLGVSSQAVLIDDVFIWETNINIISELENN